LGLPTAPDGHDLGWSRSTYFGVPDHSNEEEVLGAFLYFEQKLPNDWTLKANHAHNKSEGERFRRLLAGHEDLDLSTGDGLYFGSDYQTYKTTSDAMDVHVGGPAQLFGRRHEFALGVNGVESKSCRATSDYIGGFLISISTITTRQIFPLGKSRRLIAVIWTEPGNMGPGALPA
jgi:outer membrane receptor for ferric coprogen and ferric-rhodotorulic acid